MDTFWIALGSMGAVVAAFAAGFAAWFTYQIMKAGQQQLAISQQELDVTVDSQRDAQLPVLMPLGPLVSSDGTVQTFHPGDATGPNLVRFDRALPYVLVELKNVGPGVAFNIWGVVFESEPAIESLKQTGQHHAHRYHLPLQSRHTTRDFWQGTALSISGDTDIGTSKRYKLYAPKKPDRPDIVRGATEMIARLTLTYADIFGRKHAAIYDLTTDSQWHYVAYLRNIEHDLGGLQRLASKEAPVWQALPTSS